MGWQRRREREKNSNGRAGAVDLEVGGRTQEGRGARERKVHYYRAADARGVNVRSRFTG
jgi:hypothetical protein